MLPDVADFADIRSPQLDGRPDLKAAVLRLLLTDGSWAKATRRYREATGVSRQEAEKVIKPLYDAIRLRKARVPIRPNGKTSYTLDELDDINWWALEHAYGAATDVPRHIHALLSGHASIRAEALDHLFHTIAHQGSVYSATVVAAPFLIEVVRTAEAPDRAGILRLLDRIAFWHAWEIYEQPRRGNRPATSWIGERAFEAVRAGIPVYLDALDEPVSGVQVPALRVLCRFRGDSADIVPRIRRLLHAGTDPGLFAALVFSLSYFDIPDPWAMTLCDRLLAKAQISTQTFAAAMACMRLDPARPSIPAARVLAIAAAYPHRHAELAAFIEEGHLVDWATHPSVILQYAAEPAALVAAPILTNGLAEHAGTDEHMERWRFHDLARTIVGMLFTNPSLPAVADPPLTAARTAAIRAITGHSFLVDDRDSFDTLRAMLPSAFRDGAFGPETSARRLTPEQQTVLQTLLRDPAWATPGMHAVDMARHLLALFFAPRHWTADAAAADLTAEQRAILEAIAGSEYWRRDPDPVRDRPIEPVLRSLALPETAPDLWAYLENRL